MIFSPMFAYSLTNLYFFLGKKPTRSWKTKTCPSQKGPEPIPMVGIFNASVTFFERFKGTHSKIREKIPDSSNFYAYSINKFSSISFFNLYPPSL